MGTDTIKQLSLAETTKQSLLSLVFTLGAILAGLVVAASLGLFSRESWIIALYPGILSMRGVIGGLFSGRLSTGLHLGTIEADMFGEKTKSFRVLQSSIVVLTFQSSILLGLFALLFGVLFWGIDLYDGLIIIGVLVATMGLSILVVSPITIAVAFFSVKRGLDPDITCYPITATIADVLVTLCYLLVLSMFFLLNSIGPLVVLVICIFFTLITLRISYENRKEVEFIGTIKESVYTTFIVALIVNITGSVLSRIGEIVGHRSEIYLVYPALLDIIGGVGAIIGSTATTKLALGTIDSSFRSINNHRNQIIGAWIASIAMYAILALISSFYQGFMSFFSTLSFFALFLGTNVIAVILMICISFSVAILAFQKGLDPDNFVIPLESSLADTITTVSLMVMLILIIGV